MTQRLTADAKYMGVVERIRAAIAHPDITSNNLFGEAKGKRKGDAANGILIEQFRKGTKADSGPK